MQSPQEQGARWPTLVIMLGMFVLSITVPLARHAQRARMAMAPAVPGSVPPQKEDALSHVLPVSADSESDLFGGAMAAEQPVAASAMFADWIDVSPDRVAYRNQATSRRNSSPFGIRRDRLRDRFATRIDPAPVHRAAGPWPHAESLQLRLDTLRENNATRDWADQVHRILSQLAELQGLDDLRAASILDSLLEARIDGQRIAETLDANKTLTLLNCATYDLTRRIDLWRAAHQVAVEAPSASVADLDVSGLLADIEQYEHTRLVSHGSEIAQVIPKLQALEQADYRALGECLDRHYRNANVRVAVTNELLQRFLPKEQWTRGEIDGEILGVPVWGDSATFTRLRLRLLPDSQRLRFGLEALGRVHSDTTANSGPIYLFNKGTTAFLVRKRITVDSSGLKTKRSVATALGRSDLIRIESDYDSVWLVGPLVRRIGQRKAEEQHDDAVRETESRVAREARQRFDAELGPQLVRAETRLRKLWAPLETIGLEPTPIELTTTEKRFVSRLRLGSNEQLTGHSARPRAPSDSLASMQLHETALNNALDRLELDGQTISLYDLVGWVAKRTGRPAKEVPDTMPKSVFITFADRDALRVRCDGGQLRLTIALAKVRRHKDSWSDLVVRATYEPVGEGLDVSLMRSGTIELTGNRLRLRDQIALRGVFSKLLSKSQQVRLVPEKMARDPRLADIEVTQQTIQGGWIGVAIGPSRNPKNLKSVEAVTRATRRKQRRETRK